MTFVVPLAAAKAQFPEFEFQAALTPSAQKSAFHVKRGGKDYCLKIIAPNQSLDRVQREVIAMQSINHPNVVKVVEYEYSAKAGQSRHYIVEEFIAGTDLTAEITKGAPWSIQKVTSIFALICDGLAELEKAQIVHRDLKPSNIRLKPDGTPVIIDFGLARLLDMASLTLTADGAMVGTPKYFAPEQFRGTKRDIDTRTDLYAVGVLLYEASVGQHPSMKATMSTLDELSEAVCTSESFVDVNGYKGLPPKLRLLVGRLLEKERAKRPASAALVAKILRDVGAGK